MAPVPGIPERRNHNTPEQRRQDAKQLAECHAAATGDTRLGGIDFNRLNELESRMVISHVIGGSRVGSFLQRKGQLILRFSAE